ncbi:hypothetical protein [Mesomycoplasma lagogenitalium]|uniref:Uncharacterized protein n=1 Tax=Mesomycoplasma lagogenitalium TaxID=171286 RepID=A0ABY8LTS9_9BACT|nr:hypothetical protein [Mesomycoplasma lagogenitalium]WGI36650.1 hypothetical protein QEG99_04270 [Mesomycoplasma lagogenitalium]
MKQNKKPTISLYHFIKRLIYNWNTLYFSISILILFSILAPIVWIYTNNGKIDSLLFLFIGLTSLLSIFRLTKDIQICFIYLKMIDNNLLNTDDEISREKIKQILMFYRKYIIVSEKRINSFLNTYNLLTDLNDRKLKSYYVESKVSTGLFCYPIIFGIMLIIGRYTLFSHIISLENIFIWLFFLWHFGWVVIIALIQSAIEVFITRKNKKHFEFDL